MSAAARSTLRAGALVAWTMAIRVRLRIAQCFSMFQSFSRRPHDIGAAGLVVYPIMHRTILPAVFILPTLMLMLHPARARAQGIEVGGGVALSCQAIEESPCEYKWGRVDAAHVAWWSTPSLVVEGRVAHLDGPQTRIVAIPVSLTGTDRFYRSYTLRDERRTVIQTSVLYHFRAGHPVRPFVGGGVGYLWWRGETFCAADQIDCPRVLPADAPGVLHARDWVVSFAGGVAVEAWRGTIVRAGLRNTADPSAFWRVNDEGTLRRAVRSELPEFFLSVGFRLFLVEHHLVLNR